VIHECHLGGITDRSEPLWAAGETVIGVSIVLLNWKSFPVVLDAADSALSQRGVEVDLIIVDNGTQDGSLTVLRKRFAKARVVEMGFNSGYTGGMNAGTDSARHTFVLWQNADVILDRDYCARGVSAMSSDQSVGATGGTVYRLMQGKRTTELDQAGFTVSATNRVRFLRLSSIRDVVGVGGSCPLFRRAALDGIRAPVGYILDPWYFAYFEDMDVMLRLNLAGWRVQYIPEMLAWHVGAGSTVPRSRFYEKPNTIQVHHFKNRIATIIKSLPRQVLLRRLAPILFAEIATPAYLLLHRPRSILNWTAAWGEVWRARKQLLRDRMAIQATASREAIANLRVLLQIRH
jgi:GT2 family glycosyltransferase